MSLRFYIGELPNDALARRELRDRGLQLLDGLRQAESLDSAVAIWAARIAPSEPLIDLLLITPQAALVGLLLPGTSPIDMLNDGRWVVRATNEELRNTTGEAPIEQVRRRREAVVRFFSELPDLASEALLPRLTAALIFVPAAHRDSRIRLDIEEHRQQIKLVGLDEVAALMSMLQSNSRLPETLLDELATKHGAARLWHTGQQTVFEPADAGWRVQVLPSQFAENRRLTLLLGDNIIGRRRTPREQEYRLLPAHDDLMSNDHAVITCLDEQQIWLRDTSTNGTLVTPPNGPEFRLHRGERQLLAGTILKMGETRMALERADPNEPLLTEPNQTT
jgi:hypothetical protein